MRIYSIIGTGKAKRVNQAFYFEARALHFAKHMRKNGLDVAVVPGDIEDIGNLINRYFIFRRYATPTPAESIFFIVEELGEMVRAFNKKKKWIRNNDRTTDESLVEESGDVFMMLAKTMGLLKATEPVENMIRKMTLKGFDDVRDSIPGEFIPATPDEVEGEDREIAGTKKAV